MTEKVQFSFALSPRMRAFIEVRDALICLESSRHNAQASNWLHAACDLRASLLGDQGRKNIIPEILGLFAEVQVYLKNLIKDAPHYREPITASCHQIDRFVALLKPGLPEACDFLANDALINAYLNAQKKHDWLGHKLCMQQSITAIWSKSALRTEPLHQSLQPLSDAVTALNTMLNDFVAWKNAVATAGNGHITPERGKSHGLLVISLPASAVAEGIIPDISGNRLAIRLRFQRWLPGESPVDYTEDVPYAMMLVPIGC